MLGFWIRYAPVNGSAILLAKSKAAYNDNDDLRYKPADQPAPRLLRPSTWNCTLGGDSSKEARKSRQCVVRHACVDDQGLFLLTDGDEARVQAMPFPDINLISSRESADYYWKPRFKKIAPGTLTSVYYRHESLFVYGLFWPGHLSHFLYDGMLPLYSTMKRFNGTGSSWLLRQAEYVGENRRDQAVWEMEAILPHGQELVLGDFEVVSRFQVLPPKRAPICFDRAIVGLGSQCGLSYCVKNTPTEIYQAYRDQIQGHYWPTPEIWDSHLRSRAASDKEGTRHPAPFATSNTPPSPTNCLQSARYYNFNPKNSSLEITSYDEPLDRRGVADPDYTTGLKEDSYRPVVAIIERHGTRSVLNLDSVISFIVQSRNFRLKVLSYDHGCGIPETAYLMRDVQILISPHGNALGGSLWMASPPRQPFPVIISIDSTKYYESWFQWTTTAMGQRFLLHQCGPATSYHPTPLEINSKVCPLYRDLDLARTSLAKVGLVLNKTSMTEDLQMLTGAEYPLELLERYNHDETSRGVNRFLSEYWKNLSRYADPARLLELLEQIRAENKQERDRLRVTTTQKTYLQVCRESRCCGPQCEGIMSRNVVGGLRAYDQKLELEEWGQYHKNEEQEAFGRSGKVLRSWVS
ncbi:hypothetical protein KVV02_008659 [Mortierella alpina]|uniref:Glycosyltransferase family 61 protein n=1 Tax=Mortierella alpina TaxID=64518 RepID=A0A9P8D131_MORAP|nr:hypothetical protein KVV02_008659 [Mortierella alpina]